MSWFHGKSKVGNSWLRKIMIYHTKPYHTIPYHTIPYHIMPYHTIPYHTTPCNTNIQIKFKTSMLKSSLCDYSDAYIAVKRTITVPNNGRATAPNNRNKEEVFKNCAPFTDCISEINNTQIDNAKVLDAVMNMYSLIEYSENYFQASGSLWLYYRDIPFLDNNGNIIE